MWERIDSEALVIHFLPPKAEDSSGEAVVAQEVAIPIGATCCGAVGDRGATSGTRSLGHKGRRCIRGDEYGRRVCLLKPHVRNGFETRHRMTLRVVCFQSRRVHPGDVKHRGILWHDMRASMRPYCALHPPSICSADPRISLADGEHKNTARSPI
jgi:hypothetical protein